jgi:uncharacterized membrane protein
MHFADAADKSLYIGRIIEQYTSELEKELRKEAMIRLERAMKEAQEQGNKEESKRLREEFGALMAQ